MDRRSKIYMIIFSILFVVTIVSGITLAIYTWQTINDDIIEGESTCFDIVYVKGNDIGSNENMEKLVLGNDYLDGLSTTIEMNIDSKCVDISGVGTLYLNTLEETSDYLINNSLLNYQVLVDSSKVSSGVINTKNSIPIYSDFNIDYDVKSITVYVWLNGEKVTNDNLEEVLSSVYKGNITATAESRE